MHHGGQGETDTLSGRRDANMLETAAGQREKHQGTKDQKKL